MSQIVANIYAWVMANPVKSSLIAYHILIMLCTSLEMPNNESGMFYRFVFRLANNISANYSRANASLSTAGRQPPKPDVPPPAVPPIANP
jgi:hypothetical protein